MNESVVPEAGGVAPAAAPWPLPRRFVAVFTSPRSLFEHLAERPSWFSPLVLTWAAIVAYVAVLWQPVSLPEMLDRMESTGQASPQAMQMLEKSGLVFSLVGGSIGAIIFTLLLAVLVLFVGGFLLGGRLSFRHALSVVTHAGLVSIPALAVRLPLAFAARSSQVSVGPGAFFPPGQAEGFGGRFVAFFLMNLDLFTIWQMALIALGISVVGRIPIGKAGVGIAAAYVVFALLGATLGAALQR